MSDVKQEPRWKALEKIVKRLPAQLAYYGSALGAIAIAGNGVEGMASMVGNVGAGLLGGLIADMVADKDVLDEEIRQRAEDAISQSDIAKLLTKQDFLQGYARLLQRLDAQKESSVTILNELREGFGKVATAEQVEELRQLILALHSASGGLRAETTRPILISYSRRNREAVMKLYADLEALGFKLWRDLHDIAGGEPFWEEIKKGIDACESVVLCLSPDALKSEFVQKEWHYARQQGKRVVPVVVAEVDFASVPRWMGRVDWKDFREGAQERDTVWASFIKTLNTPYTGRKVPFMADKLPEYFINRPTEFEAVASALVDGNGAVAITAALRGVGGFGKTTLALALCHDVRVRGAFSDGVLWVTLGETPSEADLLRKAKDLITLLKGKQPEVDSREAVKAALREAIGDRHILLVLDDLWRKHDADLFLLDRKECPNHAALITTRFDHVLPENIPFTQNVDAMRGAEAVALLAWGIKEDTVPHKAALEALAKRLGEWAVLLRLVNAVLRKRLQRGDSLAHAIAYANEALDEEGLQAFDTGGRESAVKATLGASLALLDEARQAQFARLAVFPEDVDVPFTTLAKLWGLKARGTDKTAEALQDAGLLARYDLETHTIRLHDVIRQYLIDEHKADLPAWQAAFVDVLVTKAPRPEG